MFRSCSTLFLCFLLSKQILSLCNPVIFIVHSNAFKTKNTDIIIACKLDQHGGQHLLKYQIQALTKTHTDIHTDVHTDTHTHTHKYTHKFIKVTLVCLHLLNLPPCSPFQDCLVDHSQVNLQVKIVCKKQGFIWVVTHSLSPGHSD